MRTNIFKYPVSFALIICAVFNLQAQPFTSKAYKTGNYIFCGKELPKHFSYLIEKRQADGSTWKSVAEVKTAVNEAECRAAMLQLPTAIASLTQVEPTAIHYFWQRLQNVSMLDSLYAYGHDPRYQVAAGVAWFDEGITQPGDYRYRISRLSRAGTKTLVNEVTVKFPNNSYQGMLRAVRFKLGAAISISYQLSDSVNTAGVRVFRSLYLQGRFSEIKPAVMFTKEKSRLVALVSDASVTKGLTYSYVAVSYDGLGNMGRATDTLNVYNVAKQADVGMVTNFEVASFPERNGNLLKWAYNNTMNVTSIEVFRSKSYDGQYKKIASLMPSEKEYFDGVNLLPSVAYYYYIVINNGYGNSLPSARTPAILMGTKKNIIPPQNVTLTKKGSVVTLKFQRVDRDTRGYYVYRADGYVAPLQQLSRMILSTDSVVTYNDTLPLSVNSSVYSYAVASVNTSFNISPFSNRVNVAFGGGQLPVPENVTALLRNKTVFVTWSDASRYNSSISSYRVFRTTKMNDRVTEPERVISTMSFTSNSFTDAQVADGKYYIYHVQSIGSDSSEVSSLSLPGSVMYPEQIPLQPGQVSAIAADAKIVLQWTLPKDENLAKIKIYRAVVNQQAELLKEISLPSVTYEDTSAKKGTHYFYYLVTVGKNGKESRPTDAVSAKW